MAWVIRIGFWDPLYHSCNKGPQNSIGNYLGPYIKILLIGLIVALIDPLLKDLGLELKIRVQCQTPNREAPTRHSPRFRV